MRTLLVVICSLAFISTALAQSEVTSIQDRTRSWQRILSRLEKLAGRWHELPPPIVPPTGRSPQQVLTEAGKAEREAAEQLAARLTLSPAAMRLRVMTGTQSLRKFTEVDIWFPGELATKKKEHVTYDAVLVIDAWLDLAEYVGRQDVLLTAASYSLRLAGDFLPPARVVSVAERLLALHTEAHGIRGAANLTIEYGNSLIRLDRKENALRVYRKARELFRSIDSKPGERASWRFEARTLTLLQRYADARAAYRELRRLSLEAGDKLHQALAWLGESELDYSLRNYNDALSSCQKARQLFAELDDQLLHGRGWLLEGNLLDALGQHEAALNAYRNARQLFVTIGDKPNEASSWKREAEVLSHLAQEKTALTAYREARRIFLEIGDTREEALTWEREAGILLALGERKDSLTAYRRARQLFLAIDDHKGQALSWEGEAEVFLKLEQYESSIAAYRQAQHLFVKIKDRRSQANALKSEAQAFYFLEQYGPALKAYHKARRTFITINDRRGEAQCWEGIAWIQSRHGQHAAALKTYRIARQLFYEANYTHGEARSWKQEADTLVHLHRSEDALSSYQKARQLFLKIGHKSGQASAWAGEADVLIFLGRDSGALSGYRNARVIFHEIGNKSEEARALHGEATSLSRLMQYDAALSTYRMARQLFIDLGNKTGQGNTWRGEGSVLFNLGQNLSALDAYRKARTLAHEVGDELGQGNAWLGEAQVLVRLWQNDAAITAYSKARQHFIKANETLGQANSWDGEADVLRRLHRYDKALAAYRKARGLFIAEDAKSGQADTWLGEGDILLSRGRHPDAIDAYRKARQLFLGRGDEIGEGSSWHGEARVQYELDACKEAVVAAKKAAELAKKTKALPNEILARITEILCLDRLDRDREAIELAKETIALIQTWSRSGTTGIDRITMSNWYPLHNLLVSHLALKDADEALAWAEAARTPVLRDDLANSRQLPEAPDPQLEAERAQLEQERLRIESELDRTIAPAQRRSLERELESVEAALELNDFVSMGSAASTFVKSTAISAETRRTLVDEVGPILVYHVTSYETIAFLLKPGQRTPKVKRLFLASWPLINDVTRALRRDLSNPAREGSSLKNRHVFFDLLIAPFVEDLAGTSHLTIIPHGPLHELPFEALLDPKDTPLFKRWHVTIVPSLSVLHALRQRHAKRQKTLPDVAFLGIAGGAGLSLPDREVKEIGAQFGGATHLIAQRAGSRNAYSRLAPRARQILISTHAAQAAQSRSRYLELTSPEGNATRLTARDISQITLNAELVTLAACDTARGEHLLNDERLDFTRAFLISGADAVLATRWAVPEGQATSMFLRDFYQALRRGGPHGKGMRKDEALTEARRRAVVRGDDAQLWAAWVLVGDAR